MAELLALSFFQNALVIGLLASIVCGVIGSFVVVKNMSSISGGLSHVAFGGVGLAYLCSFDPALGALLFCLAAACIINVFRENNEHAIDTLISILWSVGMALGLVFVSLAPGYAPELHGFLFGNILFVPKEYIVWIALFDVVLLLLVYLFYKELLAVSFDEEFSAIVGLSVRALFLLLLVLCSFAVVVLIQVVGVILTIALLATPAVIARHWTSNLKNMMFVSSIVGAVSTIGGLFLSYYASQLLGADLPTGPVIVLLVSVFFVISFGALKLSRE